jgi:5-methylcytosine-specific restriction enzyme A
MIDLVPGQVVSRRELHRQLGGGQQQGGISTPTTAPVVLIFSGEQGAKYGYHDKFQPDGSYWYTGEGQVGDMALVRGNLAIQRHRENGKDLLLFEYVRRSQVQFVGRAEYIGHHFDVAPDREGNPRNVIVFELHVEGSAVGVPNLVPDPPEQEPVALWRRPLSSLREEAFSTVSRDDVLELGGHRITYVRSGVIKVYVLRRANGNCEGCGNPAPFNTPRGTPYLEPHHITRRADRGPDHPRWVIALCPNCHARVHRGADGYEYNIHLANRLQLIEPAA